MPEPTFSSRPAASATTAAPAGMLPQLYSYALGPLNAAYYQKQFERLDTLGRAAPSWNTAAAFCTFGWLVMRRFWRALALYAPLWLLAIAAAAALRGRVSLGLELGVDAVLAALLIVLPGLMGNVLYHRHISAATIRALQQSATLAQAQQQLERDHAVTPARQRQVAIGHAALVAALTAVGAGVVAWSSAQSQDDDAPVAAAASAVGPPVLYFPTMPSTAPAAEPPSPSATEPAPPADNLAAQATISHSGIEAENAQNGQNSPVDAAQAPALPPAVVQAQPSSPNLAAQAAISHSGMTGENSENGQDAAHLQNAAPAAVATGAAAMAAPQANAAPAPSGAQSAQNSLPSAAAAPQPYAPISGAGGAAPSVATPSAPAAPTAPTITAIVAQPASAPTTAPQPAAAAATPVSTPVAASAAPPATVVSQPMSAQPAAASVPQNAPPANVSGSGATAANTATPVATPAVAANLAQKSQTTASAAPVAQRPATAAASRPAPAASANNAGALVAGKFYLSVGVYAEASNARRNERTLRAAGLPVISQNVSGQKGPMTRIRLGPFDSRAQAEQAQRTAARQGFETSVFQHRH